MKILQLSSVDPETVAVLRRQHDVLAAVGASEEELLALIGDREIVILRSGVAITRSVLQRAPALRMIIRAGSGLDNIDVSAAREHEVAVHHIPGPAAQAVAELTIGLMLALVRQIVPLDRQMREGHWPKHRAQGHLLAGSTLGILGAGNIGRRVGQIATGIGMNVLGVVDEDDHHAAASLADAGLPSVTLTDAIASSDVLSVHVPLTPRTRGLIDDDLLSETRAGAYLVNMSRGGVVDEQALRRALTAPDGLSGAALDVHDVEAEGRLSPLADLDNVVLTPHIGSSTIETQRQIGARILELVDALSGTH